MSVQEIMRNLFALAQSDEPMVVRAATEVELGDFVPGEICHENAKRWIDAHPDHSIVRGWIIVTDFLLDAHSVIADDQGALIDVTPRVSQQRLPFIRHPGTEDEFWRMPPQII